MNASSSSGAVHIKVSPRPKDDPYSQLDTMPEKQKKQIEFIDEIYQKVVVNKNSSNNNNILFNKTNREQ